MAQIRLLKQAGYHLAAASWAAVRWLTKKNLESEFEYNKQIL